MKKCALDEVCKSIFAWRGSAVAEVQLKALGYRATDEYGLGLHTA